jgi:hypothetical protein
MCLKWLFGKIAVLVKLRLLLELKIVLDVKDVKVLALQIF